MGIRATRVAMPLTLDTSAVFTWGFGHMYLVETPAGQFLYSNPEYGGDNTIKPFYGDPKDYFIGDTKTGRQVYTIREFCGDDVKLEIK